MRCALSRTSPAHDAAGRLDQADDGGAGDRLAGPGLADHAKHLAGRDVEGDAVDGGERAGAASEKRP